MASDLPDPLGPVLQDSLELVDAEQVLRNVQARCRAAAAPALAQHPPARGRRAGFLGAAALAVAAALIAWKAELVTPRPWPTSLEQPADATEDRVVSLPDGSEVRVAPGTRARIAENDRTHVLVALEVGRLRLSVNHAAGRAWEVDSGTTAVSVVGTVFTVDRTFTHSTRVSVEHGAVVVQGHGLPNGMITLRDGQSLLLADAPRHTPRHRAR